MTFAVTGTTRYTSPTGLTGTTGANGLNLSVASGPSGPVVSFDYSQLAQVVQNFQVSQNYDPSKGEQLTGATYNGKPVYRQAWRFGITAGPNVQDNHPLIAQTGYVDAIVNSGGYFSTGNKAEKYNIPSRQMDGGNNLSAFPLVSANNQLNLSSISTLNRNNADTFVWVEYTKV
jgi:hypothetical protein